MKINCMPSLNLEGKREDLSNLNLIFGEVVNASVKWYFRFDHLEYAFSAAVTLSWKNPDTEWLGKEVTWVVHVKTARSLRRDARGVRLAVSFELQGR